MNIIVFANPCFEHRLTIIPLMLLLASTSD